MSTTTLLSAIARSLEATDRRCVRMNRRGLRGVSNERALAALSRRAGALSLAHDILSDRTDITWSSAPGYYGSEVSCAVDTLRTEGYHAAADALEAALVAALVAENRRRADAWPRPLPRLG